MSDWNAHHTATALGFGELVDQESLDRTAGQFEPERSVNMCDGDLVVGTAGAKSMDITVPGGAAVPAGGLTAVGVRSTHNGLGLLNQMMDWHFEDCRRRGESISILTASESSIYHRYGYGVASHIEFHTCADGHAGLLPAADALARVGSMRLALLRDAVDETAALYDQWRQRVVGSLTRSRAFWDAFATDAWRNLEKDEAWQVVFHHDAAGVVDGYATFVQKPKWGDDRIPCGTIDVYEIVDLAPGARLALWRYLTNIPLHKNVKMGHGMPDDPIRLAMRDPRRLQTEAKNDFVWVRILDVPAALNSRTFASSQPVAFDVDGEVFTWADGEWSGSRGPLAADVRCGIADLGAVYLGDVSWRTLSDSGRVTELAPGGIERVDSVFRVDTRPYCTTHF